MLRSPSGVLITPDTTLPGVEYEDTAGYQLYQIDNPELGTWEIVSSDVNRVFVESDFSVALIDFPNTVEVGQPINVSIEIQQGGNTLASEQWPVDVSAQLSIQPGQSQPMQAEGSRFVARLPELGAGQYELTLTVRAGNIERQIQRALSVIPPQSIAALGDNATQAITQFRPAPLIPNTGAELAPLPNDTPESKPELPAAAELILESGLTLMQWLAIIGACYC